MSEFAKQLNNIYNNKRAIEIIIYNAISARYFCKCSETHIKKKQGREVTKINDMHGRTHYNVLTNTLKYNSNYVTAADPEFCF